MQASTLEISIVVIVCVFALISWGLWQAYVRHQLVELYEQRIVDLIEDLGNKDEHQDGYETGYEAGYQDGLTELSITDNRTEFVLDHENPR